MHAAPRYRLIAFGTLLIAALPLLPAAAATTTSTIQVTANVQATCGVNAQDLNFGNYVGATGNPLDATTTITATCPPAQGYSIGLNAGTTTGGTVTSRMMKISGPGTATLNYGLYSDSTHSTIWTDIGGANPVAGTGNGNGQAITVYGRIPSGQNVQTGTYADTITVTMNY